MGSIRKIHGTVEKENLAYDIDWVRFLSSSMMNTILRNLLTLIYQWNWNPHVSKCDFILTGGQD